MSRVSIPPLPQERKAPAVPRVVAVAALCAEAIEQAEQQGHALGRWRELREDSVFVAHCSRCLRTAVVDALREPQVCGPAISERCPRPDPFLASQHESDLIGGGR